MKFKRIINGVEVVKPLNKIVLKKDGVCTYYPSVEQVIADGWVEYSDTDDVKLEKAKREKIRELTVYDESSEVNDCIIVYQGQELHYWANKTERDSLKGAIRDYLSVGRVNYRLDLREIGVSLWIPCESLLGMLAQLEVYAADCYNKTTDHEFAIKSLTTKDEIEAYDFRAGYPPIPRFEL